MWRCTVAVLAGAMVLYSLACLAASLLAPRRYRAVRHSAAVLQRLMRLLHLTVGQRGGRDRRRTWAMPALAVEEILRIGC